MSGRSRLAAVAAVAAFAAHLAGCDAIRARLGRSQSRLDAAEVRRGPAVAETDLNTSVVAIYKALGGGWEVAPAVAVSH